ncbi:MAG TPA: hypothetical protein VEZ55_14675 [Chitinophagaceae bacterium]|jgi:hypothetical protein|nr:hypothetical protein [Chitinophagaceae bacterium]
MKQTEENNQSNERERHIGIPSEANQDKHINFLEVEDDSSGRGGERNTDDETKERQRQWREGIEEGKKLRDGE